MTGKDRRALGQDVAYPIDYAPGLLDAVSRNENRAALGIKVTLPFRGEDIWTAFEISWLGRSGKPEVALATIRVPAESPAIVESKSLKLYLNSLAMKPFDSDAEVADLVAKDLARVTQRPVSVTLSSPAAATSAGLAELSGACLDELEVDCDTYEVDPELLRCDSRKIVFEALHSHLFRSKCPVTGQPDLGSVLIHYRGPRIERPALLRYLVSYRNHSAFHESCVERMFVDLERQCSPSRLTVYARFNRRGGIDINPFRSNFESSAGNPRLWRQ